MTEGYRRGTNMEEKKIGKRKDIEEGRKLRGKNRGGTDSEEVRIYRRGKDTGRGEVMEKETYGR
jgi:hypothetical protein